VTVFDAAGSTPFVADILVRDGRFSAIASDIDIPSDAIVIDGSDLSILPGLIDVHLHWTAMGGVSRADIATQLLLSGVAIALGTDSGIAAAPFGESSLRGLELLVDFGLSAADAIVADTANSAAVLGLKEDRGTIEIGKRADFVLVRGQPWQNI
jgi:imidazolonepropionase-like amidohydrolase